MISKMRLARLEKEKTQIELWMQTGIPQWRISLIERGIIPKKTEAEKIAHILGREARELFPIVE